MRKKIYEIIEVDNSNNVFSRTYDILMIFSITISIVPLMFKADNIFFRFIDSMTVTIFIIDYILRWLTADIKISKGVKSFYLYPFKFMAILDILSILPSLQILNNSFKLLRIFRLIRAFRVLKIFRMIRYSKSLIIIVDVLKAQKQQLTSVLFLALSYIFTTALIIFNVEPDTFESFYSAIYWATISLTTVGYGDVFAVTKIGQLITMLSSLFGIAIIALPAGIITGGYLKEIERLKRKKD